MGACVSTHQKPSAMKVQQVSFGSKDINLVKPPSPAKEKPPIINGDLSAKPQGPPSESAASFRDFGGKEETFFDSQAWLESDCDDDFMSVNGEFTPSRGNTPVHHNFSAGTPQVNSGPFSSGNNKPPVSPYQPSPTAPEKKMRLSDLFKESLRDNYYSEDENGEPANKNGGNWKVKSPLDSEVTSMHSGEMAANEGDGLKTKRERLARSVRGCFPSLVSSRSSSTNGRKMMMSPSLSLSLSPNPVAG